MIRIFCWILSIYENKVKKVPGAGVFSSSSSESEESSEEDSSFFAGAALATGAANAKSQYLKIFHYG